MFIPDEYRNRLETAKTKVDDVIKSVDVDAINQELEKIDIRKRSTAR